MSRWGFLFSIIPTGQPYQYVIVDLAAEGDQSERCSVAWNANVLGSEGTTTEEWLLLPMFCESWKIGFQVPN